MSDQTSTEPANGRRFLIGMLCPSSNTRLEPVVDEMLAGLPDVTAHFSRFRVRQISMDPSDQSQFDHEPILTAAELLADARVDVIVWSGTAGGWRGLDADRELCAAITERTGTPATTSTLALMEVLQATGCTKLGLVTPCPDDMQAKIEENFLAEGVETVASINLDITDNFASAAVTRSELHALTREVAASSPQAISTYCTNFDSAALVEDWETEHGIPVYDSISVAVWKGLVLAGADPSRLVGWGQLFRSIASSIDTSIDQEDN